MAELDRTYERHADSTRHSQPIHVTATGTPGPDRCTSQTAGTYRWVVSVSDTYVVPTTPIGEYYFLGTTSPA
ncbi:hypothetical protein [Nonomuraea sp. NPDC049141]|uniref:hypothetical protein n=1 Tax=Nonomuraea sp. NPDC049141 TaxID=3155500 RepID=UPI0033E5F052